MAEYRQLTQTEIEDIRSRIIYEDNHILVLNKHCGEIVQADKTGDEPLSELCKAFIAWRDGKPGQVFMGVPHRLDRPVSGIVILAKTSKALSRLAEMFRNGDVHKVYWALCCAEPSIPQAELSDWLIRNETQNKSYICRPNPKSPDETPRKDAKLAKLRYKLIGHTKSYHLVAVELLTGRHHQIRCQLAGIACPIKGDLKYGAPRSNPDGGICLHSRKVSFIHPVKKTQISLEAPLPSSWPAVEMI